MRDFLLRFGRDAEGLWLPETAVDSPSLRIAAEEGVRYTILAPWQAADAEPRHAPAVPGRAGRRTVDRGRVLRRRPVRGGLVRAEATADADRFARERVAPRLWRGSSDASGATDRSS